MKKIILAGLTALIAVGTLTACGGKDESNPPVNTSPVNTNSPWDGDLGTLQTDAPVTTEPEAPVALEFTYEEDKFLGGMRILHYTGIDTEIVIPDTINGLPVVAVGVLNGTSINGQLCRDDRVQNSFTSITVPENVRYLENFVFDSCKNLTVVNLPVSLEEIGGYCFSDCESLETIIIPENVKKIGKVCFDGCNNLKTITVLAKSDEIEIGEYAFTGEFDYVNG